MLPPDPDPTLIVSDGENGSTLEKIKPASSDAPVQAPAPLPEKDRPVTPPDAPEPASNPKD